MISLMEVVTVEARESVGTLAAAAEFVLLEGDAAGRLLLLRGVRRAVAERIGKRGRIINSFILQVIVKVDKLCENRKRGRTGFPSPF